VVPGRGVDKLTVIRQVGTSDRHHLSIPARCREDRGSIQPVREPLEQRRSVPVKL
jgi:hypothetical protein